MKRILTMGILTSVFIVSILIVWGDQPEEKEEIVQRTLRVVLWDYDVVDYDRRLVDAFEDAHPDVKVDVISYTSLYYKESLQTLLDSNQKVDIIFVNQLEQLCMLTDRNIPLELDDLIDRDDVDLEGYRALEMLRDPKTGKLLGLPYRNDRFLLYYNKDLFDKAGIPYPTGQITWEEYYKLGQQLSARLKEGKAVFLFNTPSRLFAQMNEKPFDIKQDSFENLRPGLTLLLAMQENGISTNLTRMDDVEMMQREFNQGKYAMFVNGDWQLQQLHQDTQSGLIHFRWGVTELPQWSKTRPNEIAVWQTPLCINKNSREQEAAWEFVKFVCGENGAKILAKELIVPGYISAGVEAAFAETAEQYGVDPQLCLYGFNTPIRPPTSEEQFLSQKIYAEYERILLGLETLDEGLTRMERLRQQYLKTE